MARPMGPRALQPTPRANAPQGGYPYLDEPQSSPAWYEAEQRMAPSYILPPQSQQHPYQYRETMTPVQSPPQPPVSPSARWNAASQRPQRQSMPPPASARSPEAAGVPFPSPPAQQHPSQVWQGGSASNLPPGAAVPYHYQASYDNAAPLANPYDTARQPRPTPSRMTASRFQSFPAPDAGYAPGQSGRAGGTLKGSAFMHKGFFDIMQLANDRQAQANNARFEPSPSKFKATLSRATGPLRKAAGAGGLAKGGAPMLDVEAGVPGSYESRPTSAASNYLVSGPRAAKKRISIDMVSAPRPESFVHAAHASDADQAEAILSKWGRDGMGKVADPAWVNPIKEALRLQAARNQAEAIAQIQAAMHQDSFIRDQPRQLHIVNGQPSSLTTTSTLTAGTGTTAGTAGHGSVKTIRPEPRTESPSTPGTSPRALLNAQQPPWANQFNDIAEEGRAGSEEHEDLPPPPPITANSAGPRPPMMPRSNTTGTVLVNATPSPNAARQAEAPDYMLYKHVEEAVSPKADGGEDEAEQMEKLAIDGLPGAIAATNINRMFDPPSTDRPASILVKEAASPPGELSALKFSDLSQPMVQAAGRALRPSLTTVEKSVAAKIYFENLYYGILKKPAARETRRAGLERELAALRIPDASKELIRQAFISRETEHLRDVRARVSANSFVKLKTIGHGAFGVVALVREKHTGQLFAMKQLRKADMLRKGQEGHVRAERDLMTSASASGSRRWIVNLVYSFQDLDHLYLIMEFMGGGDLLNLLIEKDIFAEDFARFYVAEMILTIREAHRLGYIHRDIKPDNFLFTADGHIKLADFGLCQSFHWAHDGAYYDQQRRNLLRKHGIDLDDAGGGAGGARAQPRGLPPRRTGRGGNNNAAGGELNAEELDDVMSDRNPDGTPLTHVLTFRDKNKKKIAYSVVGTNNYMAPEVLRGLGYDQSCDWWSLGVIVFEMLYGYPPFVSKSRHLTRQKILNWKQTLRFPPKPKVSREAQDFISRLVCEREDRLGSTSSASVSRPNSMLQNARQQSGFASGFGGSGAGNGSTSAPGFEDGVEDLMSHPWFKGIDWASLHRQKTPFRPNLAHPADTKHFEDDIEDEPLPAPGAAPPAPGAPAGAAPPDPARDPMLRDRAHGERLLEMRKQLAFVGYTFKRPPGFDVTELQGAAEGEGKSGGAAGFLGGLFGFGNTSSGAPAAPPAAAAVAAPSAEPAEMDQPMEPTEGGSRVRSMSM